jgi:hypothetical protein
VIGLFQRASVTTRRRWIAAPAVVLATLSYWFFALAPASSAAPPERGEPRLVSVDVDSERNATLVVRLGPRAPADVPATAFSVSPRSTSDPLRVARLGAKNLDLMLAFEAVAGAAARREVRAAAAEVLLTLPSGARVSVAGTAGSSGSLSTDTAVAVLALDRVRSDRTIHQLLAEALDQFERSPRIAGRHRGLLLFDVGPYPESSQALQKLSARAAASEVSVYVIRLLGSRAPNRALEQLAERTGGLLAATDDPTQLGAAYSRVLADLESRHELRFRLPDPAPGKVRVTVRQNGMTKSTTIALSSPVRQTPAHRKPSAHSELPVHREPGFRVTPSTVTLALLVMAGAVWALVALVVLVRVSSGLYRAAARK